MEFLKSKYVIAEHLSHFSGVVHILFDQTQSWYKINKTRHSEILFKFFWFLNENSLGVVTLFLLF